IHEVSPETSLILVDNGSDEDPTDAVGAAAPYVDVLRLDSNRGYAGGCNAGVAEAIRLGADYVFLLNNDTTIDAATLPALGGYEPEHPLSILAPLIVYEDHPDIVWSAGGRVTGPLLRNEHLFEGDAVSEGLEPRRVDWATGCALFLSVETFHRLG